MRKNIFWGLCVCFAFCASPVLAKSRDQEKFVVLNPLLFGTGNWFYQIAAAYAFAWDHGLNVYIPQLSQNQEVFHHFFSRCNGNRPPLKRVQYLCKRNNSVYGYTVIPEDYTQIRMYGFFQNTAYFAHHRAELLQLFAPLPEDLAYIQNKYSEILAHPCSVSVHVRCYQREVSFPNDFFIQYGRDYFEKAMALFPPEALFVVTSDDMNFAREHIPIEGRNVVFIEHEPSYIDFFLQTLCKHNIISNSTFSWWSAWLNQNEGHIVVRPAEWVQHGGDLGPEEWIRVDSKGLF